jgi:chitosanase
VLDGSGWVEPLSLAIVYDSFIHGSFARIRDRVPSHLPERQWITTYLAERREWLASISRLRKTLYRMDALRALIEANNWKLRTPFTVRGVVINEDDLI